jgi:putative hemolysin
MSNIELYLVLFVICLLLAAFFSASETSFIALQRIRLEHLVKNNVKGARRVARMIERPEKLLSTILLGSNFVSVAAAALGTMVAVSLWGERGVLIATIGVTILLLIFAETTPKTIATRHAERLSLILARPIEWLSWLLAPFVIALSWIASGFTKLVGGKPVPRSLVSPEEIRTMISVGHKEGTVEEAEAEMLHKVFEFGDCPVREVMVPRPEVISIVLMAQAKGSITDESTIDDLVRPAYFAPETKRINELFAEMRDENYRMCVVVDEYGGTAGIVSLTRLVEEIVGPVGDELAEIEKEYEVINEYTFQIDGSMRIEEANEEMELELPEGDYETVAGFVLHLLGHIPKPNEQLRYKGLKLVITEMRGLKLEKILLTKEKTGSVSTEGSAE